MSDCRIWTIGTLLQEIDEARKQEIIHTFNSCMMSIGVPNIDWQNFLVCVPGVELMKLILESNSPEYFIAVVDAILTNEDQDKKVKFVVKRGEKSEIKTVRCNGGTVATIVLAKKELKKLVEEI